MSANNQTLVKEYKGRWYVFTNVTAETWCGWDDQPIGGHDNELFLSESRASFPDEASALVAAHALDADERTEYGVHTRLAKDGADVTIIDDGLNHGSGNATDTMPNLNPDTPEEGTNE